MTRAARIVKPPSSARYCPLGGVSQLVSSARTPMEGGPRPGLASCWHVAHSAAAIGCADVSAVLTHLTVPPPGAAMSVSPSRKRTPNNLVQAQQRHRPPADRDILQVTGTSQAAVATAAGAGRGTGATGAVCTLETGRVALSERHHQLHTCTPSR